MRGNYYVGVDLHKRSYHFSILNEQGTKVRTGKGTCTVEGLHPLRSQLTANHHVVVEPVANVYWFLDHIRSLSGSIHMAHPLKVRLIAQSRSKSDSYDSRTLADLLRVGYLPEAYMASPALQELRSLVTYRQQLVSDRTRTKNRILHLFTSHGILFEVRDPFGQRGRKKMADVSLPSVTRYRVDEQLEVLDGLVRQINAVEDRLRQKTGDDPVMTILQSIPGIGFVIAVTIRAITGDIHRFRNVKAFASFTGLTPGSHQSGDRNPSTGITHQGSKALRSALIQAAPIFMNRDHVAKKTYTRLCFKGSAMKARVAVAHRLARVVYHVWKEERPYRLEE